MVALLPSSTALIAYSTLLLRCERRMLQTSPRMCVCKTVIPNVMGTECIRFDRIYVRELSRHTFDSLSKNLAWWVVTRRTLTNRRTVEMGWWALGWVLALDNILLAAFVWLLSRASAHSHTSTHPPILSPLHNHPPYSTCSFCVAFLTNSCMIRQYQQTWAKQVAKV